MSLHYNGAMAQLYGAPFQLGYYLLWQRSWFDSCFMTAVKPTFQCGQSLAGRSSYTSDDCGRHQQSKSDDEMGLLEFKNQVVPPKWQVVVAFHQVIIWEVEVLRITRFVIIKHARQVLPREMDVACLNKEWVVPEELPLGYEGSSTCPVREGLLGQNPTRGSKHMSPSEGTEVHARRNMGSWYRTHRAVLEPDEGGNTCQPVIPRQGIMMHIRGGRSWLHTGPQGWLHRDSIESGGY
ncbi:hypothetical protein FB45DRAFT_1094457 [Roridomyces roridus]|uniref:Uncharacterized protein n=1 Tax=Roridomyces roridus TaxID=1738132 RepID=A0AAD7BGH1_9AGAR|nr:hypothetical protein FB45DRAFT_1094457 [Roridomyces roridus]